MTENAKLKFVQLLFMQQPRTESCFPEHLRRDVTWRMFAGYIHIIIFHYRLFFSKYTT